MSAQPLSTGARTGSAQDTTPLLEDSDGGLLQRIATHLPQATSWRRLFPWRATASSAEASAGSSQASDMEAGQARGPHADMRAGADSYAQPQNSSPRQSSPAATGLANSAGAAAGVPPAPPHAGEWHQALQPLYAAAQGTMASSREGSPVRPPCGEISAAISPRCGGEDPAAIVDAAAFASEQALGNAGAAAPVREAGTPSDAPTRSPKAGMSGGQQSPGSKAGSPGSLGAGVFRTLLRGSNSGSGARMSRSNSGAQPTCLICLEPLTSEDFLVGRSCCGPYCSSSSTTHLELIQYLENIAAAQSGEAISLDCQCRGDLALRHRTCAIKWSRVKGDVTCDICKTQVKNLPAPSPRAHSGSESEMEMEEFAGDGNAASGLDAMPGNADMVFDCIRVTWVAMIISILFFEMSLSTALWTGIIVGIGYTLFVRAMYRQQLAQAAQEAARVAGGGSPSVHAPPPVMHQMIV